MDGWMDSRAVSVLACFNLFVSSSFWRKSMYICTPLARYIAIMSDVLVCTKHLLHKLKRNDEHRQLV